MKRAAVTHDYSRPTWGHAVEVIAVEGQSARVIGFGFDVGQGDLLLLPNGAGTTRYSVESIQYKRPADCWVAGIKFMPRGAAA